MTKVFISYSRKDIAFIEQLAADLELAGVDAWYDLSGLDGGSLWRKGIEKAIRESQYVIVVLSPNSVESEWVDEEIVFAKSLKRKIIPLIYKPCEIPFGLHTRNYIDVQGDKYKQNYKEVLRSLGIKPKESKPIKEDKEGISGESKIRPDNKNNKKRSQVIYWIVGLFILIFGIIFLSSLDTPKSTPQPTPENTQVQAITTLTQGAIEIRTTATPQSTSTLPNLPTYTSTSPTSELGIGSTMTSEKDGMVMFYVPEGDFTMGTDDGYSHEGPAHDVFLSAFWIDQTEVTNGQYAKCIRDGNCYYPFYNGGNRNYVFDEEVANYPVVKISWDSAKSYCEWVGRRLPTEAEWEKAARGIDLRIYPWGNESPSCALANFPGCVEKDFVSFFDLAIVASYPNGVSPYGALDMAGNVWEWVADIFDETYYANSPTSNPKGPTTGSLRVIRGGSADQSAQVFSRVGQNEKYVYVYPYSNFTGFRCAKDAIP